MSKQFELAKFVERLPDHNLSIDHASIGGRLSLTRLSLKTREIFFPIQTANIWL